MPFDDSSERNLRDFAFPGSICAAVVVGEHEVVREVVHEAAAGNEADEKDHADDDGELLAGQRGFLSEEPQQRIADEHEKDDCSQDTDGQEVADKKCPADDHVVEERETAEHNNAEKTDDDRSYRHEETTVFSV